MVEPAGLDEAWFDELEIGYVWLQGGLGIEEESGGFDRIF